MRTLHTGIFVMVMKKRYKYYSSASLGKTLVTDEAVYGHTNEVVSIDILWYLREKSSRTLGQQVPKSVGALNNAAL